MASLTRYSGTSLFLPTGVDVAAAHAGYLLPAGTSTPDSFGLADALNIYPGWFVLFDHLPSDAAAFIQQAQIYLSNPARAGALIAGFTNAADTSKGVSAWLVIAPRVSNQPVTITRSSPVGFANFTINFTIGTTITVSGDGNGLVLTTGNATNALLVSPMGQPRPVVLPLASPATLALLAPAATSGCLGFGLSIDESAATALDIGLRTFTAPAGGGYADTARYPIFDLSKVGALPFNVTLDPLAPLDESRSFVAFAKPGTILPSSYRTPVGGALTLAPRTDAVFVFGNRLSAVDKNGNPSQPGRQVLYLMPKGSFDIAAANAGNVRRLAATAVPDLSGNLMCGISAVEYLSMGAGATLEFVTGQSAFAPTLRMADKVKGNARVYGALTEAALTSWAYLSVPGASTYYAQPDSAVVHQPPGTGTPQQMLSYKQLEVGQLQPRSQLAKAPGNPDSFPLLPYAAMQPSAAFSQEDVAQFESQVTAPQRKRVISAQATKPAAPRASALVTTGNPSPNATTPQGMLLALDGTAWSQVTVAISPAQAPAYRSQTLLLDNVTGDLLDALQSNQLFLVISSGRALLADATIPYSLTAERLDLLKNVVQLPDAVITLLKPLMDHTWPDEASFDVDLKNALGSLYEANQPKILPYTGDFSAFVADWEFDLSPWRWGDHNSIMIFKFCAKQLDQLVSDTSQWVRPDSFNTDRGPTAIQQQLRQFLDDAKARLAAGDTDFDYFVNQVVLNPNWNGILVLDAEVPLSGLPPQLEGLAAGIDPAQFRAHHIGINVTPVRTENGALAGKPSSVFALIHYEDLSDIVDTADDYQFKVNTLKVLIANSEIANFSSTIELLINKLFGEPAQQIGASTNNLNLNGYYQKSGGVGSYTFVTAGPTSYMVSSQVLNQIGITEAHFVTITSPDPDNTTINSRFNLSGSIAYLEQATFDLFSYGPEQKWQGGGANVPGLAFSNLSIDMTFDIATPSYRTFAFDAQHILLDAATSQARANSLAAHFPMKLTGLYQGLGDVTPDKLDYMPVDSPLQGSPLSPPWFGLQFDLDLGTPGALAAQVGFTAGLLLAWAPNPSGASIYIGLSLPGVHGGDRAISLQGVLKLAFGEVRFLVQPPTYILELRNIALKFLSLTFPPNGQTNLVLFGNPSAQTSGALGWYACYLKNGAGQGGGGAKQQALSRIDAPALPPARPGGEPADLARGDNR